MSNPRSRRNGLLIPLAITATAAAASLALYYFLHDDATPQQQQPREHVHESDVEREHRTSSDRSQPRRRTASPPPSTPSPTQVMNKKSIVLVVREQKNSALLENLPSPLPLARANIFIIVYSPDIKTHPLSDTEGGRPRARENEGRVYAQARKLYPPNAPRELVMPFTEPGSLLPMLKQLKPEDLYIEGALVGEDAMVVKNIIAGGWVSGGVVVAVEDPQMGQGIANALGDMKRVRVRDVGKVGDLWLGRGA